MEKIVTSYLDPDLDGIASMYAYAEYLNKIGEKASYAIFGEPKKEVQIVCNLFGITLNLDKREKEKVQYVIVDTNYYENLWQGIQKEAIVEIIDHHKATPDISHYCNAHIQIELIGAAATLIVEKYRNNQIPLSEESAILLYYGIISNTVNLKAQVTTKRDIEATKWLQDNYPKIDSSKILEIFRKKSCVENLEKEMEIGLMIEIAGTGVMIGQLEVAEAKEVLQNYQKDIQEILANKKKEKNPEYLLLNCIDTYFGYTYLVAYDNHTQELLTKILPITFEGSIGKMDSIIMRKQLFPLLQDFLEKEKASIGKNKEE